MKKSQVYSEIQKSNMAKWTTEYLKALHDHHNLPSRAKKNQLLKGDVVFIQGDQWDHGRGNIGIVMKPNRGRDGAVRSARIKCGKSMVERAIQHLYPMESS